MLYRGGACPGPLLPIDCVWGDHKGRPYVLIRQKIAYHRVEFVGRFDLRQVAERGEEMYTRVR